MQKLMERFRKIYIHNKFRIHIFYFSPHHISSNTRLPLVFSKDMAILSKTQVNFSRLCQKYKSNLAIFVKNTKGAVPKVWAAPIILNLQANANLLKFKYEQRRKR